MLTGLIGRWHKLNDNPLIICDTGHNEDGIREVLKNINLTPHHNLHMVIGMVKDKDISKMLTLLPQKARYYFCQPNIPRAKQANELHTEAIQFGLKGDYYESVYSALESAKKNALEDDLIFIGGSTFVVAEIV
jgi:dihydrofolate synthase/folylpolyglutamate synthase